MRKLTIAALLLTLAAAASTHAQESSIPRPSPNATTVQDALRLKDPIQRDEALIAINSRHTNKLEHEANAHRHTPIRTFKAQVVVTNHSAMAIKSVSWSASLIDPGTGALIRTYDVTTEERIAPGKTKKLTKRLPTPISRVVSASAPTSGKLPAVANLKAAVTQVTYEDGTTSETP
jgi:hypothetical protein